MALLFLLALISLNASPAWSALECFQEAALPEKVKATRTIPGTFVGFESGDYIHARIRTSRGKVVSFFVGIRSVEYFLAVHKAKRLTLTYQIVDTHLPEAGPITIERISSVRTGTLSFEQWWETTRTKYSETEIESRYEPLVQKYTLN